MKIEILANEIDTTHLNALIFTKYQNYILKVEMWI